MRVRWTSNAADDLTHIVKHIRQDNPEAARRVARAIFDGVAALRTFPARGRIGLAEAQGNWFSLRGLTSPCTKSSKIKCKCSASATRLRIGLKDAPRNETGPGRTISLLVRIKKLLTLSENSDKYYAPALPLE